MKPSKNQVPQPPLNPEEISEFLSQLGAYLQNLESRVTQLEP